MVQQAVSLTTYFNPNVLFLQSDSTDLGFQLWARDMNLTVNTKLMPASFFSFTTPNSNVTARPGVLGVNVNSAASVLWVKQTGYGNLGWVPLA